MTKDFIEKMADELEIDYLIYGNFSFIKENKDDDVDILICKKNHPFVIDYLKKNSISFHQRDYYPNQIFITGTELKVHVTDDLYIGGRKVQYLLKLGLCKRLLKNKIRTESVYIINFCYYRNYRLIKTFLNRRKKMKLDDYPVLYQKKNQIKLNPTVIFFKAFFSNAFFIPFRLFKKHIWVRL
jgi:hypothetical protein